MNWLITGGCGFLGVNLVHALRRDYPEDAIRIVDNLSMGTREDLGRVADFAELAPQGLAGPPEAPVELVAGDIRDAELAFKAMRGCQCVALLAAQTGVIPSIEDPLKDAEINIFGMLNYLEAARAQGTGRVIFASSGAPLGNVTPPVHEELPARPISPYGASKLAGEGYLSAYAGSYGINAATLRFSNVYGPRSFHKSSVVAKFTKQALAGETLTIFGDGNQTRDFIYIDDLIRAVIAAAQGDFSSEVFQIASEKERTVNELARMLSGILKEMAGVEPRIQYSPARDGEIIRNFSDTGKAQRILGWRPAWSIEDGLRATVQWFLDHEGGRDPSGPQP